MRMATVKFQNLQNPVLKKFKSQTEVLEVLSE